MLTGSSEVVHYTIVYVRLLWFAQRDNFKGQVIELSVMSGRGGVWGGVCLSMEKSGDDVGKGVDDQDTPAV